VCVCSLLRGWILINDSVSEVSERFSVKGCVWIHLSVNIKLNTSILTTLQLIFVIILIVNRALKLVIHSSEMQLKDKMSKFADFLRNLDWCCIVSLCGSEGSVCIIPLSHF